MKGAWWRRVQGVEGPEVAGRHLQVVPGVHRPQVGGLHNVHIIASELSIFKEAGDSEMLNYFYKLQIAPPTSSFLQSARNWK